MNNEVPGRIWLSPASFGYKTKPSPAYIYDESTREPRDVEYRRVDPPAALASRNCVNCNHNNVDRHGICKTQTSPPNYRNITYCGCKCEFTVTPAPSDERDKALVQQVADEIFANINSYPITSESVFEWMSMIASALATVRAEGREEGLREATIIARTMAAGESNATGRQKALSIAAALESARTGKVEG